MCAIIKTWTGNTTNQLQEVTQMKVKFPQYKVTLAVSSHGAMHIEEYRTTAVRSIANAKHLFNENRHLWKEDWEGVKVISVDRAGTQEFDVPLADLYDMVYNYNKNKEDSNNEHCE